MNENSATSAQTSNSASSTAASISVTFTHPLESARSRARASIDADDPAFRSNRGLEQRKLSGPAGHVEHHLARPQLEALHGCPLPARPQAHPPVVVRGDAAVPVDGGRAIRPVPRRA